MDSSKLAGTTDKIKNTSGIIAEVLFMLFLLLKPFYILPSGSIGTADLVLAASCMVLFLGMLPGLFAVLRDGGAETDAFYRAVLYRKDLFWYLFLGLVIVVDGSWYIRTGDRGFIKYILFWAFNGAAIWTFRRLSGTGREKSFRLRCSAFLLFDILVQLALILSGKGRLLVEPWGGIRHMGTFNDPNQLAFFSFSAAMLIYLNAVYFHREDAEGSAFSLRRTDISALAAYLISLLIIIQAKSTGMLFGMMAFTGFFGLFFLISLVRRGKLPAKAVIAILALLVLAGIAFLIHIWPDPYFDVAAEDYNIITRIREKIFLAVYGDFSYSYLSRGLNVMISCPQYLISGAGEGAVERFIQYGYANEIHSGPLSILFCYGILPFIFMCLWFYKNMKGRNLWEYAAMLAVLLESFLLINYRQPLFWYIFL